MGDLGYPVGSAGDLGKPIDNEGRPRSGGRNAGRPQERGRRLAELARRQHGVVSIRQLQQRLGYSRIGVKRLVESGRLHRIDFGVYAVGHANLSLHAECLAAVLAVGPGSLLSYYSAAWLWGLWKGSPKPIHVTSTVSRHHPTREGLTRHRARRLDQVDRGLVDGIPVTSVARTLLDLASKLRPDQLRRVLARVEDLRLLDLDAIHDVIERNLGHPGAKRLRRALAIYERPIWTRSEFERRVVEYLVGSGLPRPATGWVEVGHELDIFWPELDFGVELDTWETHGTRDAFERDHDRDLDFALAGIETIRISERQFRREPEEIATKIARLLERRGRLR
ncbi:MAG TPA: type IV toxin-antitoxin system AbiEi family antitoxin domain-containing protein [Solirubrobacterales bacterium]|nr:type IV toxin-antitoxin system AbiEi family antitoxin domain-containing protein [Solirubrobacterales bacterium]